MEGQYNSSGMLRVMYAAPHIPRGESLLQPGDRRLKHSKVPVMQDLTMISLTLV